MNDQQDTKVLGLRTNVRRKVIVVTVAILCLCIVIALIVAFSLRKDREAYEYNHAAVASDNEHCSLIGRDTLKRGGNAVDAAIASLLCIGVHNIHSAGIGGGSFMVVYDKAKRKTFVYDFREEAPGLANMTMFVNDTTGASVIGGLAIGVPGQVKGFWAAHQNHGQLEWKELFTPSIEMARNGVTVNSALAKAIEYTRDQIEDDPNMSEIFLDSSGDTLKEGDTMTLLKLANTYEKIANGGSDEFYGGDLAQDIIQDVQERNGIITGDDLINYACKERSATVAGVDVDGKQLKLYSVPPPGSGAVLSLILNILDGYKFKPADINENYESTYHYIVESFKFAFAKRSALGDEDYVDVKELVQNMTSDKYAEELRNMITYMTHNTSYYGPLFGNEEDMGTSHLSIVDEDGNAVAVTSTVNTPFGAKVVGTRTGIIFNNEMDDFSTPGTFNVYGVPASPSNFIQPGKRPMSSMCPAIFLNENDEVQFVVGASGGPLITTGSASVFMRALWFEKNIEDATKERRIHHQLVPTYISYEEDFNEEILKGLEERGHVVMKSSTDLGVVQSIIKLPNGHLSAYSDDRKGGKPAGY